MPRKGQTVSEATRLKISLANKGKKPSPKAIEMSRLARIGKSSWNRGVPMSESTKEKLRKSSKKAWAIGALHPHEWSDESRARLSESGKRAYMEGRRTAPWAGKKFSDEHRKKLSVAKKGLNAGELSPSWRGGITKSSKLERTKFVQTMQALVFQRDSYTCQICSQYSGYLQVDHIKSWKDHPELRFDIENCRTLCMACHYYVTFKRKMPAGIIWGHNLSKRSV